MLLGNGLIPCSEICGLISCCNLMRHIIGCFCCRWLHALCNPFQCLNDALADWGLEYIRSVSVFE
jgi:hypothetical protein